MPAQTVTTHIVSDPAIVGGKPRISGHRITVAAIVIWHEQMGFSADEIATEHDLTLADVYAALTYYFDNREEVDASIAEANRLTGQMKLQYPSRLTAFRRNG